MKKFLILFAALIGFAACSEEASNEVNFAEMPVAEVLTVDGGVDWLLQQENVVDMDALETDLFRVGFMAREDISRELIEQKWQIIPPHIGGCSLPNYIFLNNTTVRVAFWDTSVPPEESALYQDYTYRLDKEQKVLSYANYDHAILYYRDGVMITEVHYPFHSLQIVYILTEDRTGMMEAYAKEAAPDHYYYPAENR